MRILALIPARGGSKRLPGKNIRLLEGRPLIVWSIDAAKGISEICDIVVSTDDAEIAAVAAATGVMVPWLRPADLASDTARSIDVAIHALDWYEAQHGSVDGVLLLQPTSPFRTRKTIRKGIELFVAYGRAPVLGVSPAPAHPMWTFKVEGGRLAPFMENHGMNTRSQDLPPAFVINGSFYLASPEHVRSTQSFVSDQAVPLVSESEREVIDIDTEWDWRMCQVIA
jgi:CMP-N,N'-diacetyllegionaminic acid synthase